MAEQKATETAEAVEIETHLVNEATVGDNLEGKKIAKDGRTVLSPQPSDDPEDPLNWSWARKHRVLLALILPSLLGDAGMAWGATLFEAQAETWNISVSKASTSLNWGIFLQGPGGLLIVPLIQRYGRLPLEFWSQFLTSCILIGAATSPTFVSFTALRSIQGILGVAPNVIGLSIIHDMFFFHERARKINIWTLCLATGPCLGSFISGLLIEIISWRACFGVLAGIYGLSALLVVFLGDETLYDRGESDPQPSGKGFVNKFLLLTGIAGARATGRPGTWTVIKDLSSLFILPQLLVPGAGIVMIQVMWQIGIINTATQFVKNPPYSFSDTAVAFLYLGAFAGGFVGYVWGHWFNDFLCNRYIRRHNGKHQPENRLWGVWPAAFIGPAGLVLFGQTIQHSLHWMGVAMGWALVIFAVLAVCVAVFAYELDIFPYHSALASAILNFWRTTGGFCVTYFQLKWVQRSGADITFGCQAAIDMAAFLTLIAVQVWGSSWRQRFLPPAAEN